MEIRPHHLDNMNKINGNVICAGGLLDDAGKMKGSVLVIDFPSQKELDIYLSSEPYILNKVWEQVTVEPMNVVIVNGEEVGR